MSDQQPRTVPKEHVESLIQFMGGNRAVFPDWYVAYLMQPWIPGFVPELTIHFDELVENTPFARPIRAKLGIDREVEILITGSNRNGRQAFIRSDQPESITLVDIANGGRNHYHDTTPDEVDGNAIAMHWSDFRSIVVARGPQERFPSRKDGGWVGRLVDRIWQNP